MHKNIIDGIYNEKAKNDSNSRDLARTLNVLSKTVFGDVNRFIFELLQNADDSSEMGKQVEVEFRLVENYLIFTHNGKHFTEEDVRGISGIGNRASKKDKDIEKTGYKGIGFKSIFGSSDYVFISSGGFKFRFDKNHSRFSGSEDYPWQVVPIWTENPAEEVIQFYDNNKVTTVIGITNRGQTYKEIINVFEDCQVILFLRKISKISFFDSEKCIFNIEKVVQENNVQLLKNRKLESTWILKDIVLNVENDLSEQLSQLSDAECPQKLKEAKRTKLTFAAKVENGKLVAVSRSVIYSYLPTKSEKGFPFLINGDFLTNAERTELMQNIWNEFLFKEIAKKQLEWFSDLQSTVFKYDVLKLLKGKYADYSRSRIDSSFNGSLEEAARTISFLPIQDAESTLTTISNSVQDVFSLSKYFHPTTIISCLNLSPSLAVINLEVNGQEILSALGSTTISFSKVLEIVRSGQLNDVASTVNFVVFFYNNTINNANADWIGHLKKVAFIIDQNNHYRSPQEIYLPTTQYTEKLTFSNLSYIHSDIILRFESVYDDFIKWLANLGVKEPDNVEIFRKSVLPLIGSNAVNEDNVLEITNFIFKTYQSKKLTELDYMNLQNLPVQSNNGLYKPSQVYFSAEYTPEKDLTKILINANFLSGQYVSNEEERGEWKSFFKRIGVRENISIDIVAEKIERKSFENKHIEALAYFSWLEANEEYPRLYHSFRYSNQHYIENYTKIEFRDHLADTNFSKYFWAKMFESWDTLKTKCSNTKYYYWNGSSIVPSFLSYYIANFPSIPATDGSSYKSVELHAPSLKAVIGDILPVSDFPTSITKEQIEFFGFKTSISMTECLLILDHLASKNISSDATKQIFAVYNYMIGQGSESRDELINWRKEAKLLAVNNTMQSVDRLYVSNINKEIIPVNSGHFLKLPPGKMPEEVAVLSNLLMIPLVSYEMLQFVHSGKVEDLTLKSTIETKIIYLAIIQAHNTSDEFVKVVEKVRQLLKSKTFYKAEELKLVYSDQEGQMIIDLNIDVWDTRSKEFYYTGDWKKPVTLYSLSNSLCEILELKNMEREFALLFQLSTEDIIDWLKKNKFNVEQIEDLGLFADDSHYVMTAPINEHIDVSEEFNELSIGFVETVKVEEISHFIHSPQVKQSADFFSINKRQYNEIESSQVRIDIGRWSEEYVNKYFTENPEIFTSVKWMNEEKESYLPYDFEITESGIEKLVEVKGTTSMDNLPISISFDEWKVMLKTGKDYSIFRVFGAGGENHRMERSDNLKEMIYAGALIDFPIKLYL